MQFGCLAFDEIIQVSDQPVALSFGSTVSTGALLPAARFLITCHVVPSTVLPCSHACWLFV